MQHQRIDQRIDRQVIRPVILVQERAAIVIIDFDIGIAVRPIGVIHLAALVDDRIDLHRIDVLHTGGDGGGDIIPAAGDDELIAERFATRVAVQQMRQHVCRPGVANLDHLLVADVVGINLARLRGVPNLVIRRPENLPAIPDPVRSHRHHK